MDKSEKSEWSKRDWKLLTIGLIFLVIFYLIISLSFYYENDKLQKENEMLKGQINETNKLTCNYTLTFKDCYYKVLCKEMNNGYKYNVTYQGNDCKIKEERLNNLEDNCEVMTNGQR